MSSLLYRVFDNNYDLIVEGEMDTNLTYREAKDSLDGGLLIFIKFDSKENFLYISEKYFDTVIREDMKFWDADFAHIYFYPANMDKEEIGMFLTEEIEDSKNEYTLKLDDNDLKALQNYFIQTKDQHDVDKIIKQTNRGNFDFRLRNGFTLLHDLVYNNLNPYLIRYLGKAGANPNIFNRENDTPLILAVKLNRSQEYLIDLIRIGALVNVKDENGDTPLMISIKNKNYDLFTILLKNPRDPAKTFVKNDDGFTAEMLTDDEYFLSELNK